MTGSKTGQILGETELRCVTHYPGSLIKEIGADESERRSRPMPRGKGLCAETVYAQPK